MLRRLGRSSHLRAWPRDRRCVVPLVLTLALFLSTEETAGAAPPSAPPAHGGGETSHDRQRALDLFEQSMRSYREGRFQEAVDKLIEARKLKPEPVLLYNLARAYEALGRSAEAADAYTQYLAEEPSAADRKAIEGRIATLRTQAAELAAARKSDPKKAEDTTPPPSGERRTDPNEPVQHREPDSSSSVIAPWIVAGVGVLAMGTGLVVGAMARSKHDSAVEEPIQLTAASKQDSAESLATGATVTLIAGAIVTLVGVGWIVFQRSSSASPARRSAAVKQTYAPPMMMRMRGSDVLRWTF